MIDLGTVRPGQTIYFPFDSFAGATGASITLTGLAVTDIEVYKDGGTTQRASDTGYTLLDTDGIDFDGITGIHGFSIDLSSNATAGFWAAGSRYFVVVSAVTIDGQTVNFIAGRFRIGYDGAIHDTTIATLASQTSFTLTAGSADDSAYVGCLAVVHDVASGIQVAQGYISAYTGSTKTVTLAADPAIFTMAATDNISIMPRVAMYSIQGIAGNAANLGTAAAAYSATRGLSGTALPAAAADAAGGLAISDAGGLDLDTKLANTNEVTTARMGALTDWINGGRLDLLLDLIKAATDNLPADPADASVVAGLIATLQTAVDAILVDTGTTLDGRIPAALVGGRMDASVGAAAANTITASALAADAVAEIADGVWDEATAGHTTAGSTGKALIDAGAAGTPPTVGEIADAVWDEDATGHQTGGTFGQAIGDPGADTNTIFKAVVSDAAGATVGVDIVAVKVDTAATLVDTAEIGVAGAGLTAIDLPNQTMDIVGNITGNLSGSVGSVTGAAGSVTGAVGSVTGAVGSVTGNVGGNVTGTVGSLAAQAKADVNAEVVDALATDTYAEPGQGTPASTATLAAKLNYLYKNWRNRKTQTATVWSLFNDDAVTVDQKATVADDATTASKTEIATGP